MVALIDDLVPTDMGHTQRPSLLVCFRKPRHATRELPEAGRDAMLRPLVEEQLQSETDPEIGAPPRRHLSDSVREPRGLELPRRVAKRADPRQQYAVGCVHDLRVVRDDRVEQRAFEGFRDAAEVSGTVIHQRDPGAHAATALPSRSAARSPEDRPRPRREERGRRP